MKLRVSIPRKEISQALADLRKYDRLKANRVQKVVATTTILVRKDAVKLAPVNEGLLRAQINFGFSNFGLTGRVESNANYSSYVENGRGKGKFPPLDKIARWAKLKGLTKNENLKDNNTKRVVYFIGRKIARFGTKAQPFMRPALEKNQPGFFAGLRIALGLRENI